MVSNGIIFPSLFTICTHDFFMARTSKLYASINDMIITLNTFSYDKSGAEIVGKQHSNDCISLLATSTELPVVKTLSKCDFNFSSCSYTMVFPDDFNNSDGSINRVKGITSLSIFNA